MARQRMTGKQRRDQLILIGRSAFAERGYEGTTVEEIATRAGVSKPVIYEHFGGKEGLYRAVVEREMELLHDAIFDVVKEGRWRDRIEQAVFALLTYVEEETDGFLILAHGQLPGQERTYSTVLNMVTAQVSYVLAQAFRDSGLDGDAATLYGQALVGTVSNTALWWLDVRTPDKESAARHIANLCWNGLRGLEALPHFGETEEETEEETDA